MSDFYDPLVYDARAEGVPGDVRAGGIGRAEKGLALANLGEPCMLVTLFYSHHSKEVAK